MSTTADAPYKLEQQASRERLAGGFSHPDAKPGDKIRFGGSGDRYVVLTNGARLRVGRKLNKAQKKQAKKQRREDREMAAVNQQ